MSYDPENIQQNKTVEQLVLDQINLQQQQLVAAREEAVRLEKVHNSNLERIKKHEEQINAELQTQHAISELVRDVNAWHKRINQFLDADPLRIIDNKLSILLAVVRVLAEQNLALINREVRDGDKQTIERLFAVVEKLGDRDFNFNTLNSNAGRDSNLDIKA